MLGTSLRAQLRGAQIHQLGAQQPNPDETHYYLGNDYFLKMHSLDKTVEYLRDAGSGFPNFSDIYADTSSERAPCFERKGDFCCLRPVLPVC